MSYCKVAADDALHGPYHDREYGFPVHEDNALFERLVLEINQAGLSWATILRKRAAFKAAYAGFDVDAVAAFDEADRERLMNDTGIVRNRLKIDAAIYNAQVIQKLQRAHGSFQLWLDRHHPLTKAEWMKVFKKTFRFTGGEIVGEFLMSTGYLAGAHEETCPVYEKVVKAGPAWKVRRYPFTQSLAFGLTRAPEEVLKELQTIPGVGKSISQDLWQLGIKRVADLKDQSPEELYARLCMIQQADIDMCMLYVLRCAVYYARETRHNPELLKWWAWKDRELRA
jgi:DNA-3-methyladenine glycosylase I